MRGVWFGGISSIRDTETEIEWGPGVMAGEFEHKEEFEHKYVGLVASIIGMVVVLLGLGGVFVNLFVM